MTARFGVDDVKFRRIMTSLTGGAVCMIVLVMAIYMISHSTKKIGNRGKEL